MFNKFILSGAVTFGPWHFSDLFDQSPASQKSQERGVYQSILKFLLFNIMQQGLTSLPLQECCNFLSSFQSCNFWNFLVIFLHPNAPNIWTKRDQRVSEYVNRTLCYRKFHIRCTKSVSNHLYCFRNPPPPF